MTSKNIFLAIAIAATALSSCTKKTSNYTIKGDYFIAGRTGGFVDVSAKASYYLISNAELREDNSKAYQTIPTDDSKFNFSIVLPAARYNIVKNLPSSIPAELLAKNNADIGAVVIDAGYMDVRAQINGVAYKWSFEGDQTSSSPAVQQFVAELNADF